MFVIGIDPGLTGGLAAVDGNIVVATLRMPVVSVGKHRIVDGGELYRFLDAWMYDAECVVIERNSSRPGQGVASSFAFGRATGAVEAAAMAVYGTTSVLWVSPRVWKPCMGLNSNKELSLRKAAQLLTLDKYTSVDWSIKANHGIAEAALLARYAMMRTTSGGLVHAT